MGIAQKLVRNALWQVLSFLPKNSKKVVCQRYYGRGYSDSPKALAEELRRRGWKVYWTVKSQEDALSLPEDVTPLVIDSPKAIWHLCTAGAWVDNSRKWAYTQKRGATRYVQTWHGFPLKRIEGDAAGALDESYVIAAKKDSAMCDLFLSNSVFLTEVYRRAFWYQGEVLECGFPRNDMLFVPDREAENKVRGALGLAEGKRLALYAPTFRRDQGLQAYDLDCRRLTEALGKRFGGEWLVLAKLHPNIAAKAGELNLDRRWVVNASGYADIQDLYLACGALVTDYSSVMFDYMNTGKPCFLYVNDVESYRGDRNFYFDLDSLPFVRSEDNHELERAVLEYEEERQRERTAAFCREWGIKEDGSAARRAADWLEGKSKA